MVNVLFLSYLVAVVLAGLALWTIRFEFGGKAATRLEWATPAAFAVLAAGILLGPVALYWSRRVSVQA